MKQMEVYDNYIRKQDQVEHW